MIKGRLFVVNENSLKTTLANMEVSIKTPELTGSMWLKTISDIMADMLQIEKGDYVFLWEERSTDQKSRIHGVYRAISSPFYEYIPGRDDPFKIKIEEAYTFSNPITEYDLLNCPYIKESLWTIVGKKVAGKPRGTTPLSPAEVRCLITLLIGENPDYSFNPPSSARWISVASGLKVDYSKRGPVSQKPTLAALNPNNLAFFEKDGSLKYEKTLETIFNQEMSSRNAAFFSQIGIDVDSVLWYSNYLPYSIERTEMDYLIMESDDKENISRLFLIEFTKGPLDADHIAKSFLYSKWINQTLALGTNITQPIIICRSVPRWQSTLAKYQKLIAKGKDTNGTKKLKVYTFDFTGMNPVFRLEF